MSNEIRRKPEMSKANPYNDIKLLFGIIISLFRRGLVGSVLAY